MKNALLFSLFLLTSALVTAQIAELSDVLAAAASELEDVATEKYSYEQQLEYDAEKPWRATFTITETSLKNDKSEVSTFYLNLADVDPKLVNIETDKEEQLVVMKCRRRQNFIRLTDEDGDVSYDSELQLWSPEIDKAIALRDLFRRATELAAEAWAQDFSPGSSMAELNGWLEENVVSVDNAEATTRVEWATDENLPDLATLTVSDDEGEDVTTYSFSVADLSKSGLKLVVKREAISVAVATAGKASLLKEEREGAVTGYENALSIPVVGIEEAGRLLQVIEAALPLARKIRDARMPAPTSLDGALRELSELVTGAKREGESVGATLSAAPLATLELEITDTDKGTTEAERYLFDFGDLNAKKVDLRVKGTAISVAVATKRGQDFVQQWEDGEEAGFDDEVVFPVNNVETARKLEVLLPYVIEAAAEIPVSVGTFGTIETAVREAATETVSQSVERREEDCKWSFLELREGKKTEEILYEYNLYDLDPKQVEYEVTSKGVFLEIKTLRKEETINVYENDEPSFTNVMNWRVNSLAEAKQLRATLIALIEGCSE